MIARGNAICFGALSSIRDVPPPASGSITALAAYLRRVRPIVDKEAAQLATLPRPSSGQHTLNALIDAFQANDRAYRRAAAAAGRGDSGGVATALSTLRSSKVVALAKDYGLTACTGTGATVS